MKTAKTAISQRTVLYGILCGIGVLILLIIVASYVVAPFFLDTVQMTVTEKNIKRTPYSNKDRYLIYGKTANDEIVVFENTDQLLWGKFDSTYVYGGIEVGKKYEFTVGGFRIPFLSWHQNIKEYKLVEEDTKTDTVDESDDKTSSSAEQKTTIQFTCKDCGESFELTQSEIDWYKEKRLTLPKRCESCRAKNKAENA